MDANPAVSWLHFHDDPIQYVAFDFQAEDLSSHRRYYLGRGKLLCENLNLKSGSNLVPR